MKITKLLKKSLNTQISFSFLLPWFELRSITDQDLQYARDPVIHPVVPWPVSPGTEQGLEGCPRPSRFFHGREGRKRVFRHTRTSLL